IPCSDGSYRFETLDPAFLLCVAGEFSSIAVQGEWEIDSREVSLGSVGARLLDKSRQIDWLQAENRRLETELAPLKDQTRVHACQEELRACEERLHAILASRSWRLVSPLRAVWSAMRRRRSA